jgi:ribose 5-phosphate isomerase B
MIKIAIGSDHAGFEHKEQLRKWLRQKGYEVTDFGTFGLEPVDYPDFAHPVALAVEKKEYTFGVLLCGSANGVAMAANKHEGIRAALCWTEEVGSIVRQHNDANILCLPARFISVDVSKKILDRFLVTAFEGGRHQRRVDKINC